KLNVDGMFFFAFLSKSRQFRPRPSIRFEQRVAAGKERADLALAEPFAERALRRGVIECGERGAHLAGEREAVGQPDSALGAEGASVLDRLELRGLAQIQQVLRAAAVVAGERVERREQPPLRLESAKLAERQAPRDPL